MIDIKKIGGAWYFYAPQLASYIKNSSFQQALKRKEQMKKAMIIAAMAISLTSCTEKNDVIFDEPLIESRMSYDSETIRCIHAVYDFCISFNDMFEIPASLLFDEPTIGQMIEVIRYCDLQDQSGDIFVGWDEYDTIKAIIWPNGYGKEA